MRCFSSFFPSSSFSFQIFFQQCSQTAFVILEKDPKRAISNYKLNHDAPIGDTILLKSLLFLFHHLSSFCFCFYLLLSLLPAMSLAPLYELECNIHYLSFQFKTPEVTSSHSLIEKRNRAAWYHHHYALPSTFALTATQCTPYTLHIYPVVKDPPPTLRSSQHFWIPHRSNASGNTDETDETESIKVLGY